MVLVLLAKYSGRTETIIMSKKNVIAAFLMAMATAFGAVSCTSAANIATTTSTATDSVKTYASNVSVDIDTLIEEKNLSTIYLAGGCFWGVEEYMTRIAGVYDAVSGYANGNTENPSYHDVIYNDTGHAETVRVVYDKDQISLQELLDKFFLVIDPTSIDKQGNDVGSQYRTGIYYSDPEDKQVIDEAIEQLQAEYDDPIAIQVSTLDNFYDAEEYHQDYLQKNVNGYCHINLSLATQDEIINEEHYTLPSEEQIRENLTDLQYDVTRGEGTEVAFSSELNNNYDTGIYVDILTGEPLFLSTDKYDSGTGWPSFTKPIAPEVIIEDTENATFFSGTELKSRSGSNHLGHVFNDGPKDDGGLRYCINGASLRFVPYELMVSEGYGYLQHLLPSNGTADTADE